MHWKRSVSVAKSSFINIVKSNPMILQKKLKNFQAQNLLVRISIFSIHHYVVFKRYFRSYACLSFKNLKQCTKSCFIYYIEQMLFFPLVWFCCFFIRFRFRQYHFRASPFVESSQWKPIKTDRDTKTAKLKWPIQKSAPK